jgi:hypothetical protein
VPDIPKYINIKKQSILKLLEKNLYGVTGVTNSAINTTKKLLVTKCLVDRLLDGYWQFESTGLLMNNCTIAQLSGYITNQKSV